MRLLIKRGDLRRELIKEAFKETPKGSCRAQAFKALMKKNAGKHRFEGLDEGIAPKKKTGGVQ